MFVMVWFYANSPGLRSGVCPIFASVRRPVGEAVLHGEQCRLGAGRDSQLGVDVLEMRRDGLARDREIMSDLGIRPAIAVRLQTVAFEVAKSGLCGKA